MSHTTTIRGINLTSIELIERAINSIATNTNQNIKLVANAKPRMYYSNQEGICDFIISLPGKYDVGLKKTKAGYDLVYDDYGGYVHTYLGSKNGSGSAKAVSKLIQQYAVETALDYATTAGYVVEGYTTDNQGNVHLTINTGY